MTIVIHSKIKYDLYYKNAEYGTLIFNICYMTMLIYGGIYCCNPIILCIICYTNVVEYYESGVVECHRKREADFYSKIVKYKARIIDLENQIDDKNIAEQNIAEPDYY